MSVKYSLDVYSLHPFALVVAQLPSSSETVNSDCDPEVCVKSYFGCSDVLVAQLPFISKGLA